ncbi:SDR family oxidoreductase [Actinocorallia populi]|uniref:SDR family oxidoreductase n=1 Tax=Actinocorallia populi TaxID=2079200 RepID=UPI001E3AE311|nr:SDR family oxidoreductase [Actinocorallia populi]
MTPQEAGRVPWALLEDKVVVVSGAGPGLGRAIAVSSAQAGAKVVVAARSTARLEEIAEEIHRLGGTAAAVPVDLTDRASITGLVDRTRRRFGRVDAVVFNAFSRPPHQRLLDTDSDTVRQSSDINLLAALELVRAFAPGLQEHHGSVVMINSMVLRNRLPDFGAYRVMKAGLLALARSLSVELGPLGVRVNSVAPGYIWADSVKAMFARLARERGIDPQEIYDEVAAETDLRRLPEPDDIANAVVFLASDAARAVTGQCLDVNCGHTHH